MLVIFCCTGNTCRSPMAEALFKEVAAKEGLTGKIEPCSAGIAAFPGLAASPQAQQVMKKRGLDISQHTSQPLNREMVEKADLVLGLTSSHVKTIKSEHISHSHNVYLLKEYSTRGKEAGDIIDPFGSSVENYQKVAEELEKYIEALAERLASERL